MMKSIFIKTESGKFEINALIDTGSKLTAITKNKFKILKREKESTNITMNGLGQIILSQTIRSL